MLLKKFSCAAILVFVTQPLFANTVISAADPQLQYTGRIDFTHPATPEISWPGTSIAANFTGPFLALTLDDQLGKNYFNVFIDHNFSHSILIQAEKGEKKYVLATHLAQGKHTFLLTKRTEGEEGTTQFKGLELADNASLLNPPPRLQRKIEFFGDSITSGMDNESADDGPDQLAKDKNNFMNFSTAVFLI